jgi:putative CocE/NonD family hydrolase
MGMTKHSMAGLSTLALCAGLIGLPAAAQTYKEPSPQARAKAAAAGLNDVPASFDNISAPAKDYSKRVVEIPMRDGVRLHTILYIPNGAHAAPMILERTPYDASGMAHDKPTLAETLPPGDAEYVKHGYIRVYQDIRGKYGSQGDYVVTRPMRGPLNPTTTDHGTDAWDTIDWLVKNVPQSNGKVGMIGSSYDGFTGAVALIHPHPALGAVVSESPVLDAWKGDDWFHYGAFRNIMLGYIQMQTAQRGAGDVTPTQFYDKYEEMLRAGSTADYAKAHGLDKLPWMARTMAHPDYDAYWQGLAFDKFVAANPSNVPTIWEQGLWDQEDMWGANHAWLGLKAAGHLKNNWLIYGPWSHSQVSGDGKSLGVFNWDGDTALQYRRDMVMRFFEEHLRGGPPADLARVTLYNTGKNKWERLDDWPASCQSGCPTPLTPLYLQADHGLAFAAPQSADGRDSYVSDPAKPVPFLERPVIDPFFQIWTTGAGYKPWSKWLVADQRFADSRTDVLVYETPVLDKAVHVRGVPLADIRAMTTGTDGDFVVKLIDVYPATMPSDPKMGGYQLAISLDIFRGRYRDSFEKPSPIPANTAQGYKFELPAVNHVFLPGHRIMVQIQSSLFPLYDRNPQTYVPNIFFAKPQDYKAATVSILRSGTQASAVWLPVIAEDK